MTGLLLTEMDLSWAFRPSWKDSLTVWSAFLERLLATD